MKEKQIQLTLTTTQYIELLKYCMEHEDIPELKQLNQILQDKLNRLIDHEIYTKYKTAPTAAQREQARQEYLDRKGISQDFRWKEEKAK